MTDDLKILSKQRAQLRSIAVQLRKECFAGRSKVGKPLVIAVVQHLLLGRFPEAFDQFEVLAIRR